jgi:hypothetical protein
MSVKRRARAQHGMVEQSSELFEHRGSTVPERRKQKVYFLIFVG